MHDTGKTILLVLICLAGSVSGGTRVFAVQGPGAGNTAGGPDETSFEAWRDVIRAAPGELEWQDLPWETSYHAGLVAAAEGEKPLLLWAMNGHPMGCT